jgi:hypothetical protein
MIFFFFDQSLQQAGFNRAFLLISVPGQLVNYVWPDEEHKQPYPKNHNIYRFSIHLIRHPSGYAAILRYVAEKTKTVIRQSALKH